MAIPSCPKCGKGFFTTSVEEPSGSKFKLIFVSCSSCGAVVGVMDYFNVGHLIVKQSKAIKAIAQQVGAYVDLD